MASAKDIIVKPITSQAANAIVKKVHYSGKVVQNSTLHLGVFLDGVLEGAMQFGSPMDKRKVLPMVSGTQWTGMLELNRMAFSERLPRFSESRALSVAFRLIKKSYPHIEWVVSFSDGAQCGDGTIYRASGFVLTQIKENNSLFETPAGVAIARMTWDSATPERRVAIARKYGIEKFDSSTFLSKTAKLNGMKSLTGFQLKYVYFLNPEAKARLTVPILPFSKIDEMGAGMYKGQPVTKDTRAKELASGVQPDQGGVTPTCTLQLSEVGNG